MNGRFPGDIEGEVTCIANEGSSVVDYFIASSNLFQFITDFEVCNRSESVHFPIFCSLTFDSNVINDNSDDTNGLVHEYVKFRWKDTMKDTFLERFNVIYNDLRDVIFDWIQNNINDCVQTIVKLYQTAAECMRIKGRNKSSNKQLKEPWWDQQCENLKKEKYKALRYFRRTNDAHDLNNYKQCRGRFKDTLSQKKFDFQKRNREELIESRRNSNLFWKTVKKFRYKDIIPNPIKAGVWVNHFKQLLFIEGLGNLKDSILEYNQEGEFSDTFNAPFSMSELRCSIRELKLGKSGGPDGIIPELITNTMNEMSEIFLALFNKIFETGCFPENWSNSLLCPILKSGSISDPNNYRGISLIDIFNKILTGMMYKRLYSWAEEFDKIDETQAGFRKEYSTVDNLFTLMAMGQKYLSKRGGRFYCLFVDFSKAFDRVNHTELINSLIRKGVHGKFLNLLIAMYSQLCTCVKLDNHKCSSQFRCNIGTRQGCKLSTILFTLFLNDLIDELKGSGISGIQVSIAPFYVCADRYVICADLFLRKRGKFTIICAFHLRGF